MCRQLESDVIAFAYRSFSLSDEGNPNEQGFMTDVDAITAFFAKAVSENGGASHVESILWGQSFGCATAIVANLALP